MMIEGNINSKLIIIYKIDNTYLLFSIYGFLRVSLVDPEYCFL
jgi:hypothetical protein